jgi:hypothetical protein
MALIRLSAAGKLGYAPGKEKAGGRKGDRK